jgi:hypothetical protein
MSNVPETTASSSSNGRSRGDQLPPIQPPSAGFLLQLFVIPLVIVTIIVLIWLMFSWLAHLGSDPRQLVSDLQRLNEASWQKALTLAELLRNPDYEHLKRDPQFADELAQVLAEQLDENAGSQQAIKLRVFLARALGELHVPSVLPPLLEAAAQEHRPEDLDVRRSAVEALAVYASHNGASGLQNERAVMEVLLAASRERSDQSADQQSRAELRSAAAFALGVVGGEEALNRLETMTTDAYSNARFNAALGLARHGDRRAEAVLLEMLDPQSDSSDDGEPHQAGQQSKRLLVVKNGIRGAAQLASGNRQEEFADLEGALQQLIASDLTSLHPRVRQGIRIQAEDALIRLRQ